ncbi:MAG: hypothetical protein AB1449_05555 [Chloroflexota bacterium]
MKPDRGSSAPWVVLGLVVGLLCCLCLLLAAGLPAAVWVWGGQQGAGLVPLSPTATLTSAPTESGELTPFPPEETPASTEAFDTRQLLAQAEVPVADPLELAERLQGLSNLPRVVAEQAAPIPVGSVHTFWVQNEDTTQYFQIQATMVYATPHVYFWVEQGVDYDLADVQALVDEFETRIYPTDREFFGSEWTPGVDGDPHLYILYARNLGSWVAGYYGSNDEYSPLVHEYSNAHEMFYINADIERLTDEHTYSTLAHEFQHMIHWRGDGNEDSWVDEGFAELASFLNGYSTGGWDYAFAEDPDIPLTFWPSGSESGVHYGQAFLVMAYFLDRFGEEATQALVANPDNGLDSIDETLASLEIRDPTSGEVVSADDFYADFAAALLLLDPSVGDGRYSLESYPDAPTLSAKNRFAICPVAPQQAEVNQYGIDVVGIQCRGEYTLEFAGETEVQVVPADPHSGEWAFWSNRGNVSDMRLTRSFDLRDVEGPAELFYWVWYDIEEDWDYVYVLVSDDDGASWDFITTPSGTAEDPTGNSYGWGYTGYSGGGASPVWIEETVDLSSYAGEKILVRFEYVTDASVNGDGLLLDDVSIPAIGYTEDFEAGDGGWQAEGFVRLYNRLPQTFQLVLVEHGRQTRVTDVPLDEHNQASVPLVLGAEYDRATLLVIGTARYSWRPAPYRFQVR